MSNSIPKEWESTPLENILYRPLAYGVLKPGDNTQGGVPVVRIQDIRNNQLNFNGLYKISQNLHQEFKRTKLNAGDLIISLVGTIGKVFVVPEKLQDANVTRAFGVIGVNNEVSSQFVTQWLNSDTSQQWIQDQSQGNAQKVLNLGALKQFLIYLPPLPEQQKIATILSSVDNVIEKTRAQIDKLKDLKTGMMQELLTKGIGHTEFKDSPVGRIPVGWSVKCLPDVSVNHDSKRVPIKSVDRANIEGSYRYYGASGVIDYVNDYIFDGTYILLGEDGENVLSRNLPLAFIVSGKFWVNNHAHVLTAKPNMDINFLCEYLESIDYTNIASGSAQPKITQGSLNSILVPIPPIDEQRTICSVLKSIDKRVEFAAKKLGCMHLNKKALMQDLLTGKVRVNT